LVSVCGLTESRITSAPAAASRFEATIRTPYWLVNSSRRSGRGSLPTIWPGPTSLPRSSPAMIDSAITPEPIVATVRFESGDMRRSIGVAGAGEGSSRAK